MLINKKELKLTEGEIFAFKLVSGEEIYGKIETISDTEIVINKPYMLAQTHSGIGVAPATMVGGEDAKICLVRSNITFYTHPLVEFVEAYKSAISKIEVPTQQGIIT